MGKKMTGCCINVITPEKNALEDIFTWVLQ